MGQVNVNRRTLLKGLAAGAILPALPGILPAEAMRPRQDGLNLDDPADNLHAFIKTRCALDEREVVFWWKGNIYSFIPGQFGQRLFQFEGFNVGRTVEVEGGYQFLTREAAFYQDPLTGEILETWANPFTEEENQVVHVWNDPVNQNYLLQGARGPWFVPYTDMGEGQIVFNSDILLAYPNPLPASEFPELSREEYYQAGELFQFYTQREDLEDPDQLSIPTTISWTRLGPFLPWMHMGDAEGMVVYHTRGKKLPNGYADLPQAVRDYVAANHPEYNSPPEEYSEPNETSWTYYRKLIESGEIE